MKVLGSIVIVIGIIGLYFGVDNYVYDMKPEAGYVTHEDGDMDLKFEYRDDTTGYVLQELEIEDRESGFVKGYQLMLKEDYAELELSDAPRDGPPTIAIITYENDSNLTPEVWAEENPIYSNIAIALEEPTEYSVDGVMATRYMVDGLYRSDIVLVSKNNLIYMFSGSFLTEDSAVRRDYEPLLNSIEFLPIN